MSLTKEILVEEIKKTKSTILTIEAMRKKHKEQGEQIEKDCLIGLDINNFVLEKLKEEWKLMS